MPVHGVALNGSGYSLSWSGETPTITDGPFGSDIELPKGRTFANDAEPVGVHLWCDYPHDISRRLRGWFAGQRVSTLQLGGAYVHSASRWLGDPLETPRQLAEFGEALQESCLSLGIGLKGSPGSAALALWRPFRRALSLTDDRTNDYCEHAVYGGRAELFRAGEFDDVVQWDRASAYPSELTRPLPAPGSERWASSPDLSRDGVSEAIVSLASGVTPFPVLPCRVTLDSGENRTLFPWGEFHGRWTHLELRAARERGYKIRLLGGVEFSRLEKSPYARFAEHLWRVRDRFPYVKRVGVSFVGKLHQHRDSRTVAPFGPFRVECQRPRGRRCGTAMPGYCLRCSKIAGDEAAISLGAGAVFIRRACVAIVLRETDRFAPYVNMPAAAYVLARARLELLELLEANRDDVVSVATDGAILTRARPAGVTLGKGFGEWRREFGPACASVVGPTAYRLVDHATGKAKVRTAGVARTKVEQFLTGEVIRWQARAGLMQGEAVGKRIDRHASISREFRDRAGFIEPPRVRLIRRRGIIINRLV